MGEREWFQNVWIYTHVEDGRFAEPGCKFTNRNAADTAIACVPDQPAFRIHVRLKPEGAPKRYASRDNQRAWEANTEGCTRMVLLGFPGEALV